MPKLKGPSPAMVVACLSLAVALSGVGYAAVKIPRNSVGTVQLKANAVTGAKVKANTLGGADINEASLQGVLRPGSAAGGSLAGTFPDPTLKPESVGSLEVQPDSLTTADIDESTLDVVHGSGQVALSGLVLAANTGTFDDVALVPGAGYIQATCNADASQATLRFRDTSGTFTYVWVDDGGADPRDLRTPAGQPSPSTVTSSDFDLLTWFVRPGAPLQHRSVVHLAVVNESGNCTFYSTVSRFNG